ncbi:sulfur carrier protein ThiS [Mariniflexile litorale]|uniref:Sulfur carrier protein ThiS n=1 Tax=Mariniflexile litorale TaxID=3045158 RepID=A0AAU7EJV4_9FLAO|nr:sulfur carrier protein ThiS [Mariniflexile sp. KMM 9835]MDQ8211281.1 sulfur carrier protein ThiS [Mariniflexile sp. KMM 9835]
MITIHLNERSLNIDNDLNILQLLQQVNSPIKGIAVAINANIISQSQWETVTLNHDDNVLIIQATQGG